MIGITLYRRSSRKTGVPLPGYYCSFRVPGLDGKSKQVSRQTGKTKKGEAEDVAVRLREVMLKEANASSEQNFNRYALVREAVEASAKDRLTHEKGYELLNRLIEIETGKRVQNYTVGEWLDVWLKNKKVSGKNATYLRYKNSVSRFKSHLGTRMGDYLVNLTMQDLQSFRDNLHSEGRSAKTSNGYLKDIRSCLKLAVKEGLLTRNPGSSVEVLSESDSVSREPFTSEEVDQLLSACGSDDEWRGLILLGASTGLRIGDAAKLKAGNVDLVQKVIQLVPQKTSSKKKVVRVPMTEELESYFLDHALSDDPEAFLFPGLCRKTPGGRNGLSLTFGRLMDTAAVSRKLIKHSTDGAGRTQYARSFHSLRHSFNTWMADAGVSQEDRMLLTGHTTKEVNDGYTHKGLESMRASISTLPKFSV